MSTTVDIDTIEEQPIENVDEAKSTTERKKKKKKSKKLQDNNEGENIDKKKKKKKKLKNKAEVSTEDGEKKKRKKSKKEKKKKVKKDRETDEKPVDPEAKENVAKVIEETSCPAEWINAVKDNNLAHPKDIYTVLLFCMVYEADMPISFYEKLAQSDALKKSLKPSFSSLSANKFFKSYTTNI